MLWCGMFGHWTPALRMALINTVFAERSEAQRRELLNRLLVSNESKLYRPAMLGDVMMHLEKAPDARHFEDLSSKVRAAEVQEFILRRFGASREKAAFFTPAAIKALRPPGEGVYLVWQMSAEAFEAYYPKALMQTQSTDQNPTEEQEAPPNKRRRAKTPAPKARVKQHVTCSRQYGAVRTTFAALWQCVNFLWTMQEKAGRDTGLVQLLFFALQ